MRGSIGSPQTPAKPNVEPGRTLIHGQDTCAGRTTTAVRTAKNHLLAALPAKDFQRLLPHLTTVPVRLKQVLHRVGKPLRDVYFLNGGAASIVTLLSDDTMVEAATVGNEGMLGIEAFLSAGAIATATR